MKRFFTGLKTRAAACARRVRDLIGARKVTGQIRKAEGRLDRQFAALGKKYLSEFSSGPDPVLKDLVAEIRASQSEISALKASRNYLKGITACPLCGSVQTRDNAYCSACGTKLPEPPTAVVVEKQPQEENLPAADMRMCPVCGKPANEELSFCTFCGTEFAAQGQDDEPEGSVLEGIGDFTEIIASTLDEPGSEEDPSRTVPGEAGAGDGQPEENAQEA